MNLEKLKEKSWIIENSKLKKEFIFKSYLKTISFVNAIAWEANKQNHHPDLLVSFNKCIVFLTTHDLGNTISDKDTTLALAIEKLFDSF